MTASSSIRQEDPKLALFRPAFDAVGAPETAWDNFAALGLPTRAQEPWHYADLGMLARAPWDVAKPAAAADRVTSLLHDLVLDDGTDAIIFVNGRRYNGKPVAAGAADGFDAHGLTALNKALSPEPAALRIAKDQRQAVRVVFLTAPAHEGELSSPRLEIDVADNAVLDLELEVRGTDGVLYWNNAFVDIRLGDHAEARVTSVVREGNAAYHTGVIAAHLQKDARFVLNEFIFGGRSTRREALIDFAAAGGAASLGGAYLGADTAKIDIRSEIKHNMPHCRSEQLYRGVLDDKASAAFQGCVYVAPQAQKTDAAQTTRSLLLSRTAEAAAKPELEIHADDVKCSHGATVGELDADMLFYMKARGIPADVARAMLVQAFIGEVVEAVTDTALRERLLSQVSDWMSGREVKP